MEEILKGLKLLLESQKVGNEEIIVRLDALQEYLAGRDPQFWQDWPIYLAAARKKLADSSAASVPPENDKIH